MKGWFGDKFKHSLASKGISARQIKDIYNFPTTINYDDPEEFISAFWIASLKNDFSDFDFEKVFQMTREDLYERMNRYGYLSFTDFYNNKFTGYNISVLAEDYMDTYDWFREKWEDFFYNRNDYVNKLSVEEMEYRDIEFAKAVYDIANKQREESWAGVDPTYDKLFELYEEMEIEPILLRDKILLMDKIIDTQHHRGSIWYKDGRMVDIEQLRNRFERYYGLIR